jgi:hypothetical protein
MTSLRMSFISACILGVFAGVGCSSTAHEFSGGAGVAAGGDASDGGKTATGGKGQQGGGVSSSNGGSSAHPDAGSDTRGEAGQAPGEGGAGPSGSAGSEASGGASNANGGSSGSNANGGSGGKGSEECPAFSCCIAGKTFDADAVSPLNACEVCKPAQSTKDWTVANGKVCESEQGLAVQPKTATYKKESCALMCNSSVQPMAAQVPLSLKFSGSGQNITTTEYFVELDFSNLIPESTLSVTKAVLKLYAAPDAPTAEQRWLTIVRKNTAQNICKILLPTDAGFVPLECDITSAVQSWLASPAGSERVIKVSVSAPADRTASILTALTPDGTQRPVLSLDYSGKCSGKVCPQLVE